MRSHPATTLFFNIFLTIGPTEAVLFQKLEFKGLNVCLFDFLKKTNIVWSYVDELNSSAFNVEVKKCCFFCLHDPKCFAYQIIRSDNGKGYCYSIYRPYNAYFFEENVCKSFVKTDKKWNCIIEWNPVNYLTQNNAVGYRVRKTDNSWAIYNNSRGIHVVELNETTCLPKKLSNFDVAYANRSEQSKFVNYFDKQVSNGTYMICYTVGKFYDSWISNDFFLRFGIDLYSPVNGCMAFARVKGLISKSRYQQSENVYGFGYLIVVFPGTQPFISLSGHISKEYFFTYNDVQ